MTDFDFLTKGYRKFEPNIIDTSNNCVGYFQKLFKDDLGKKYFITIYKYGSLKHPHSGEIIPESYEYNVQLYKKDGHDAVNLLFHSSWKLDDVEDYLEELWATGLFDYYEENI